MSLAVKPALAAVALLFTALPLGGALAVGDGECREYATAAIRQVHIMHEHAACNRGTGSRWSSDWNIHYRWCREVNFEQIGAERDARTNWLRACGH